MDDLLGAVAEDVGAEDAVRLRLDQYLGVGRRLGMGLGRAPAGQVVGLDREAQAPCGGGIFGQTLASAGTAKTAEGTVS